MPLNRVMMGLWDGGVHAGTGLVESLPLRGTFGDRSPCSTLQKVGIWAWDDLCWASFFSRLWGWRTVMFQRSGFY